jgi:hypothetical protein
VWTQGVRYAPTTGADWALQELRSELAADDGEPIGEFVSGAELLAKRAAA